jgi:hypothetical protein
MRDMLRHRGDYCYAVAKQGLPTNQPEVIPGPLGGG